MGSRTARPRRQRAPAQRLREEKLAIIDTAPHAMNAAHNAAEIGDLALVPCRA